MVFSFWSWAELTDWSNSMANTVANGHAWLVKYFVFKLHTSVCLCLQSALSIDSLCTFNQPFVIFVCGAGCGLLCLFNLTLTRSCVFSRPGFRYFLFTFYDRSWLFRILSNKIKHIVLSWCLSWVCICPHRFPPSVKRDDSHTPIPYLSISLFLHFSFSFLFGFGLFVSSSLMSLHLLWNHSSFSFILPQTHFFSSDIFMCI